MHYKISDYNVFNTFYGFINKHNFVKLSARKLVTFLPVGVSNFVGKIVADFPQHMRPKWKNLIKNQKKKNIRDFSEIHFVAFIFRILPKNKIIINLKSQSNPGPDSMALIVLDVTTNCRGIINSCPSQLINFT